MSSIKQKITSDYWLKKVEKSSTIEPNSIDRNQTEKIYISADELTFFKRLTNANFIAEYTMLLGIYQALLNRYFEANNLIYTPKITQGNGTLLFYNHAVSEKTLKSYIQTVKKEVQEVYKFAAHHNELALAYPMEAYATYGFIYDTSIKKQATTFCFNIQQSQQGMTLQISFDVNFVSKNIATHFIHTFKRWLTSLNTFLDTKITQLSLVTQTEKQTLLYDFNKAKLDFPQQATIIDLFEQQVAKVPESIAVIHKNTALTYAELNEKANQFADYLLKSKSVQKNDFIGIKLERNQHLLVALLAVLKVGATYVPIDIHYPEERVVYIEKDSRCKCIIDAKIYEAFTQQNQAFSKENHAIVRSSEDIAYIIYTSGTTGNPKGVMMSHRNAVALIYWAKAEFNQHKFDTVYAVTSHCFDLSIFELFFPLAIGKKIRILKDALSIQETIAQDTNVLINTVPSGIRNIFTNSDFLQNTSIINLAGEPFPVDIANMLKATAIEVRNLYGPSEDTTYSTFYKIQSQKTYQHSVSIGKPIANTQAYILDENLQLVPIGIPGKLYLSGEGLSKGYLNNPKLTAEKFITNPFREGAKMYDTGDIAKWNSDGNIDFLGRKDNQVKIRGYRIELGEIENSIRDFSKNVSEAVAIVKGQKLIAFYEEKAAVEQTEIAAFLKKKLPTYIQPSALMRLEKIPLTPNGKIDRKKLLEITIDFQTQSQYVAPTNIIEKQLVDIWQEVLNIQKIGVCDNFFELGGQSLLIIQTINKIYKELHKTISYEQFSKNPTIRGIAALLTKKVFEPIPKVPQQKQYALTASQHRIWVLSQLDGGNVAYNMHGAVTLKGKLHIEKFEKAFQQLIGRHEILRTYFEANNDGNIHQVIIPEDKIVFKIPVLDFQNNATKLTEYVDAFKEKPFDLTKAPLLRASILKQDTDTYIFSFVKHHIIGDGWSMELLISEVIYNYNQLLQNDEFIPSRLPLQFKDYAAWANLQKSLKGYQQSEKYWESQFQGEIPVLELPTYRKRPIVQTYHGATHSKEFSAAFATQLKNFAKKSESTLFITLFSGITALLYRYSNQEDIVIGTPVAGRTHPDLEQQIGLYLNTLAIRTQIVGDMSFESLLQKQKQHLLTAYEHQQYSFDELVSKLNVARDTSRSALFDVMIVLQNQQQVHAISSEKYALKDIEIEAFELPKKTSQFDISFTFEDKEQLSLEIEYNTDIYDASFIENIHAHFENLLLAAFQNAKVKIEDINYITEVEHSELLALGNSDYITPSDKTIVTIFEEQVMRVPKNTALIFENKKISYSELNEKANQFARYLHTKTTLHADDFVAVKIPRSEQLLIVILGILKAGAAYVPIDLNYPKARIQYIEKDSNCAVIVDEAFMKDFHEKKQIHSKSNLNIPISKNNVAYMIYTSGTTGNPKGVMVTHKNVVSIHTEWQKHYKLNEFSINLLQLASVSFDVFMGDLSRSLLNGGTMVMPSDDVKLNPEALYDVMAKHQISIFEGTPSLIIPVLEYIQHNQKNYTFLKRIIFGSDSIPNTTYNAIKAKFESQELQIINSYGVTETTIDATFYNGYLPNLPNTTPIGKPFDNTAVYILNTGKQLTPKGVFGELYIGGAGVSNGYYNKPRLTESRFVHIPHTEHTVYATGDIARWLPDGNIEFLGRNDHQVKIRGYRIELGEIENALLEGSVALLQAVVEVKSIAEEKKLVAYVTAKAIIDKIALKKSIADKLPAYMIPDFFIQLKAIPLTPNGKVDRKALPELTENDLVNKQYVAPKNETEAKLVDIWKNLLVIARIGIKDDFFALGGHSLKITKLKYNIEKVFQITISFNDLFLNTTIEKQAVLIQNQAPENYQQIPKIDSQQNYILSSAQQRIWVLSQFEGSNSAYNMPGVFQLSGEIDAKKLEKAFQQLIIRHESLRTQFIMDAKGAVKQEILSVENFRFQLLYEIIQDSAQQQQSVRTFLAGEFNLEKAPLLRAKLIKTSAESYLFVFVIHHIVSDGWSIDILKNELFYLYNQKHPDHTKLTTLQIQYKDYAAWEILQQTSAQTLASKSYWMQQFSGELPVIDLPYKTRRPKRKTYNGATENITISKETLASLQTKCSSNQATLFMGLLGIVTILIHRYTQQEDIIIGTPVAGRTHADLQHQIGVYINTLPIRTRIKKEDSFQDLLATIKNTALHAYKHQAYPFDTLVDDLSLARDLSRNPLFDVMVTLQNTGEEKQQENTITNVTVERFEHAETITAKFDLDFMFEEIDEQLQLSLVYNTDLFSDTFITEFAAQFEKLTESIVQNDTQTISEFNILTPKQEQELCIEFNNTQAKFDEEKTLIDYIKAEKSKHPEKIAVQDAKQAVTYEELHTFSEAIACYLVQYLGDETRPIGVVLDRSVDTIVLLLGILKSGKSYIPLDATFPIERLKYIVTHSGINTIIGNQGFAVIEDSKIQWLHLENILSESKKISKIQLPSLNINNTAYIIYTSGSTGNPKGVAVGHASLINFLLAMQQKPGFSSDDTLFAVTTYAFDISILEFFLPLISGGTVYIASNDTLMDVEKTKEELLDVKPTVIQATPSFFQLLFNSGWKGNSQLKVLCGGDALPKTLAQQLTETCQEVWNMYGPTETTIWSTTKKIDKEATVSLGKPIANTQCYILDDNLQLLPKGAQGNLYIGGKGLALGYYLNDELTSKKFIKNPFGNGLIYETGDSAAWNEKGELIFYGRNDYQVKVRGYRIELGDIETHLNALEEIQQAVVLVKNDHADQAILVAYYKANNSIETGKIKNLLKNSLPVYMIPSVMIQISEFPLTPNKKIDRKALLIRADKLHSEKLAYKAPETATEIRLATLWSSLLTQDKIGKNANFFDLGGHSLSSAKLVSLIQNEFSVKLTINKIFEYPELEQMANHIDNVMLIQQNQQQNQDTLETDFENFSI